MLRSGETRRGGEDERLICVERKRRGRGEK